MDANTAKTTVLIIALGTIVLSVLLWFPGPVTPDYVRTSIECFLLWFLYQGKSWARWVTGLLLALACSIGVYIIAKVPLPPVESVQVIITTVFYAGASYLLISGKVVGPHFGPKDT